MCTAGSPNFFVNTPVKHVQSLLRSASEIDIVARWVMRDRLHKTSGHNTGCVDGNIRADVPCLTRDQKS